MLYYDIRFTFLSLTLVCFLSGSYGTPETIVFLLASTLPLVSESTNPPAVLCISTILESPLGGSMKVVVTERRKPLCFCSLVRCP